MSRRDSVDFNFRRQKRFTLNLPLTRMIHSTRVFSRVSHGFKKMSDRVAFLEGRAVPRLALTGLALLWLAGCSSEVTRFDTSSNPFSNPFASQTAVSAPTGRRLPAMSPPRRWRRPRASPAPLHRPSPPRLRRRSADRPPDGARPAARLLWSAKARRSNSLSRRYGVPSAALLSANGLSSPTEVKGGMHIVVPVYNAGGRAVAAAPAAKAVAAAPTKKRVDVASNDRESAAAKAKKAKDTVEKKAQAHEKSAAKLKDKASAVKTAAAPAPAKKTVVAKADAAKPAAGKKPAIDVTPTGNVDPKAAGAKAPVTAAEADASGATPEFRWPARGRIIEGFKTGGNDGINISVPPGTSVRAAESGVVLYSGDGLKGYGNLVLIKHPNGFVTAYANNGELDVKRGETVKRGQIIAKSGDFGDVNAPQLHFELRKGSTPVDPTNYLAGL